MPPKWFYAAPALVYKNLIIFPGEQCMNILTLLKLFLGFTIKNYGYNI